MSAILALLAQLAPLFVSLGVPAVEQIWKMFSNPTGPTQADWDTLKTLTATTARQQMMVALLKQGIDPASPQGLALLALTPP